ncbi:unnamed protein product [Parnassius apollo]|uniref:(apollo) hypothetical protein n=1 Tax=Parnassius apollo TaxID=110799 RepID=A0A8S3W4L8_PARAO|nr:unnamed protein product [Parnassius apollo]
MTPVAPSVSTSPTAPLTVGLALGEIAKLNFRLSELETSRGRSMQHSNNPGYSASRRRSVSRGARRTP